MWAVYLRRIPPLSSNNSTVDISSCRCCRDRKASCCRAGRGSLCLCLSFTKNTTQAARWQACPLPGHLRDLLSFPQLSRRPPTCAAPSHSFSSVVFPAGPEDFLMPVVSPSARRYQFIFPRTPSVRHGKKDVLPSQ